MFSYSYPCFALSQGYTPGAWEAKGSLASRLRAYTEGAHLCAAVYKVCSLLTMFHVSRGRFLFTLNGSEKLIAYNMLKIFLRLVLLYLLLKGKKMYAMHTGKNCYVKKKVWLNLVESTTTLTHLPQHTQPLRGFIENLQIKTVSTCWSVLD